VISWLYVFALHQHSGAATYQRVAYFSRDYFVFGGVALLFFWYTAKSGMTGWLYNAMAVTAMANFVFIFLQTIGFDPYGIATLGAMRSSVEHPIGLMTNKNETSAIFAFCAWGCTGGWRWFVLPCCIAGLVLSASMSGIVALAAGLAFYWVASGYRARWLIVLVFAAAFAGVMDDNGATIAERVDIWTLGDRFVTDAPLLGMGVGLWPLVTKQLSAHNDFLQLWLELGTFSMLLLAGYACCVLKQITIDRSAIYEASAVVTVAVLSAISFPLQIAPTRLLALAWIGILAAKKWRYRR
jgi:hypothetical protein